MCPYGEIAFWNVRKYSPIVVVFVPDHRVSERSKLINNRVQLPGRIGGAKNSRLDNCS